MERRKILLSCAPNGMQLCSLQALQLQRRQLNQPASSGANCCAQQGTTGADYMSVDFSREGDSESLDSNSDSSIN